MLLDINDLLGKPYKAHGRGPASYDCYGLVLEVEKRLGKTMPDLYKELSEEQLHDSSFISQAEGYKKVKDIAFGDVIVFKNNKNLVHHIGVYLRDGDVIHCDKYGVRLTKLYNFNEKREVYRCQN